MSTSAIVRFMLLIPLHRDQAILDKIAGFDGELDVDGSTLVFSLQGLFEYLNDDDSLSYVMFRKMLYSSRLNEALMACSGRVEVHRSTGKVDQNLYRLVRIGDPPVRP
jgi:hypothetical protein